MSSFRNVLVGIDLLGGKRLDASDLGPATAGAVQHATWLAQRAQAHVTFFTALNQPAPPWCLLHSERGERGRSALEQGCRGRLQELVRQAQEQGARAQAVLAPGKAWVEIIQRVRREGHDLVVIGARDHGLMRRALFGSTAQKLLHNCPCPVWITRPGPHPGPRQVLIASDFSPAADNAVCLGLALARLAQARAHLLHVVDYPLEHHWSTGEAEAWMDVYRRKVRSAAEKELNTQLERCGYQGGNGHVAVHVGDGAGIPDEAILQFIHDHAIDLVVLGTVARGGLAQVLLGNTAERLLPELRCSVLAVKPPDFHCPVPFDSSH
jgi:universal stress protein E